MAFDIDSYKQDAAAVRYDDLDCDEFIERPLSPEALRCLRSMSDIESHTVCYLRDLLVTPSHADPTVTTFLTMWNFEEYWHGEALAKILAAHGIPTGSTLMCLRTSLKPSRPCPCGGVSETRPRTRRLRGACQVAYQRIRIPVRKIGLSRLPTGRPFSTTGGDALCPHAPRPRICWPSTRT